jgi:hypothetical protein
MQGIDDTFAIHPSDEELADFVDKSLDKRKESEILKHLISCDECSDVVALVLKYGKQIENVIQPTTTGSIPSLKSLNSIKITNTFNYKGGIGILLSGLAIASLIIFIKIPSDNTKLGVMDLSILPITPYQANETFILKDVIIDADKVLNSIVNSTDVSKLQTFHYAEEQEKVGKIKEAKAFYKQAFIESLRENNNKKRLKKKIVIHSRLFHLSKGKELDEYREILRYEIRLYISKFEKKE